jgi:Protein of unknown function (DUF559)
MAGNALSPLAGRGKGEGELRHDLQRPEFLHAQGYRIERASNEDVDRNLDSVLETILAKLTASPSSWPSPRTRGEGTKAGELRQILEARRPGSSPDQVWGRPRRSEAEQGADQQLSP